MDKEMKRKTRKREIDRQENKWMYGQTYDECKINRQTKEVNRSIQKVVGNKLKVRER